MKIKKTKIPRESLVNTYLPADYTDTFVCESDKPFHATPDDLMIHFWTDFPAWANMLFRLRNFLVKFVGLKTDKNDPKLFEEMIRTSGKLNFSSVPAKNEQETILLLEDKHLDAYISVYIDEKKSPQHVYAITLVHFRNKLGTVYFFFIKPFHTIIVKNILKRTVKTFQDRHIF